MHMTASCREGHGFSRAQKCVQPMLASKQSMNVGSVSQSARGEGEVVLALNKERKIEETQGSDIDLVARVQAGDRSAFQLLVERYQNRAYALAFQILKHQKDAEDVVQEDFVKAYLSIKSFQGNASFFTWFYRILVNMAIDFRRKIARQNRDSTSLDVEERDVLEQNARSNQFEAGETPLDISMRREQATRINQVLASISADHRAVIVMREVEGLRYEQIADVLGVSKGTVMSRLHYARKKLQQMLGDMLNYRDAESSKELSANFQSVK